MTEEVKIKEEPVDPEYDKIAARIKAEPEDIPEDFFDDIENNEFLNELIDNFGEEDEAVPPNKENNIPCPSDAADGANSEASDEIPIKEQIEKLTKIIERRKKKLVGRIDNLATPSSRTRNRSRSKSASRRSAKRRRSTSRDRIGSRSKSHDRRRSRSRDGRRSISRDRRSRRRSPSISKVSDRRSRSKGRRSRSIESRRRHRSRSLNRSHKAEKKISFLDELEKIFAEKGQTFPEKDQIKRLMHRKGTLLDEIRSNARRPSPYLPAVPPIPSTSMQPNYQYPTEMPQGFQLPMPMQIKTEPVDYNTEINGQQNSLMPEPVIEPLVKRIKLEKEEDTVESRREKVLKMCTEALVKLRTSDENPLKTRFFYTPAVIIRSGIDESLENRSPLNQINNVQYKFNSTKANLDLDEWGLWKPSDIVSNVIRDIGFDVTNLIDKLSMKDIPTALKQDHSGGKGVRKDGKTYTSFYTDSGTQTDQATCSTCILRQLRKFVDKGVQGKPLVGEVAIQTEREDELPIMNTLAMLNSSQLIALNDFSDIIKSPAPTNTTELYRLREKMMDIFNLSQRPCMMPAKFSTPQAPSFNVGMSQYFETGPQIISAQPQIYARQQPQPNMNHQFPFQGGAPGPVGMMNPFSVNMPSMHQTYPQAPQPVPPPNANLIITPRRDDPRHRERSSNPPPPPRIDPRGRESSGSSSGKTFGRGSKSFSTSRR